MKRRGFLQALGGAVAVAFAPGAVASKTVPSLSEKYLFTKYALSIPITPNIGYSDWVQVEIKDRPIFHVDICVWDGAKYRRARHSDDLNLRENRVAIAVSDGNDGFHYMREGTFAVQVTE